MADHDLSYLDAMRDDPEYVEAATTLAHHAGEDPAVYLERLIEQAKSEALARGPVASAPAGPIDPIVKRFREMLS